MSLSDEEIRKEKERFLSRIAALRATPEERARILAESPSFDVEAWLREAPPASPEELAEMEELLREREAERQRSLAAELAG